MFRLASEAGRFVAEALILLPTLAIGLVWTGMVFAGLFNATLVSHHRPAIEELMTMLLIVAAGCSTLGFLLFAATRDRRS